MLFASIPPEIVHCILIEAVRARGRKRAARLRLVSREWDAAVEDAIFDSGILDENDFIAGGRFEGRMDMSFWQRYLAYRTLHHSKPLSLRLAMIRQVAEQMAEMKDPGADEPDRRQTVRYFVSEICHAVLVFRGIGGDGLHSYLAPATGTPILFNRTCINFRRAILAAAAYMNEVGIAHKLIAQCSSATTVDTPLDTETYANTPLFFPELYSAAAYKGNEEFISYLHKNESELTIRSSNNRAIIIYSAIWGNQMGALELGLGSTSIADVQTFIASGLSRTTSVDMFRHCFKLLNGNVQHPSRARDATYEWKWRLSRFHDAAERGAVELMEYLAQLGASVNGRFSDEERKFCSPISQAALNGHEDAVRWLLNRDAALDCSLHAAVAGGSRSIVQLLIEHGACRNEVVVRRAVVEAVKRENEGLFRLLVAAHGRLDMETIEEASKIAEAEELVSMKRLLQEDLLDGVEVN
ncbi:hypothetical protein ONZ43_g4776 [Nemania bipapillata]|uniref:Uncharacterized protein n=1 Tax=Nemania bipapillata TaxID=110536 RepID=A0ACC2IIQ8_9PEZI|nr:hypothetical protein ONZ43_g4776 [Nemania bipapillata]